MLTRASLVSLTLMVLLGFAVIGVRLRDGERVVGDEPERCSGLSVPEASGAELLQCGRRLPLNRVTAKELLLLPGIGAVKARRIVEYRRDHGSFARIEDLGAVNGIGPVTVRRLRSWLVIDDPKR